MTLVLALWLLVAPFALDYQGEAAAVQNGLWAALLTSLVAVAVGLWPRLALVQVGLGMWLALAPLLLAYGSATAALSHFAAGLALVALAPLSSFWRSRQDRDARGASAAVPRPQLREPL